MRKLLIAIVCCVIFVSCSPETKAPTEKSNLVYIGEFSETIDDVTYNVKSYADVKSSEPYFYTYYKYYYFEGNLRRLYVASHGIGSSLDYPYTNYKEHLCAGNTSFPTIYTYHENGKLESVTSSFKSKSYVTRRVEKYDSEGNKASYHEYHGDSLYSEYTYYSNGNEKTEKIYNLDSTPSFIAEEASFYESGNAEKDITYYSNGKIKSSYEYYDSASGIAKTELRYASDGTLLNETYRREDGTIEKENSLNSDGSSQNYTYYDSGNLKTRKTYYSNGKMLCSYEYYDSYPSVEKSCLQYNESGVLTCEQYKNEEGKMTLKKEYYADGALYSEYAYYASGNVKTTALYFANGKNAYKVEYYDSASSVEKSRLEYNEEGVLVSETYKNEDGKPTSVKEYSSVGVLERDVIFYDSGYKKTEVTYYRNGQIEYKRNYYDLSSSPIQSFFSYSYEGVLVEERYMNSDGTYSLVIAYYETTGTLKRKATFYESGFTKNIETYYDTGEIEYYSDYYDSSSPVEKKRIHYWSYGKVESEQYRRADGSIILTVENNDKGKLSRFMYYYADGSVENYYECNYGYLYTYESGKTTYPSTSDDIYSTIEAYTIEQANTKLEELRPTE